MNNEVDNVFMLQEQIDRLHIKLEKLSSALAALSYSIGETNTLVISVKKEFEDHKNSINHPYIM